MGSVSDDATQLKALLDGGLVASDAQALETKLDRRPELRRMLADLVLEAPDAGGDRTIRVQSDLPRPSAVKAESVDVGVTLGQGGMAIVRVGRQLKLDRPVAVKTLRGDRRSQADVEQLLREARVTGRLEHPNIVPVHDIVRGSDGAPQVVLKLIEGHTWSDLMQDAEQVRLLFGATDLLEWNLGVLMSVTRALAFAHSRGVVHRDVKPSNVMLGAFGEVYLVDWGIARELDEPNQEDAPFEVAGSSGYMAPEQLLGDKRGLGSWTDTYLLGATLYQVLTGKPPHSGVPLELRVSDALDKARAPPLPESAPAELRRIVERALEPEYAKRTQTPDEFRFALEGFLRHRGALRLVEQGDRDVARLAAESAPADEAEWESLARAAEVAYRAALDDWPDCEDGARGLVELAVARIERALGRGEIQAAGRIAEGHSGLPASVLGRVEAARTEAAENAARLRRIVTDADRGFGLKLRGLMGAVFGLVWVTFWCVVAFRPPDTVLPMVVFTGSALVVGSLVVVTRAKQLLANRINRASMAVVSSGMGLLIVWLIGASALGLEMRTIIAGTLFVCATFAGGMATLVDPWGAVSMLGFAIAFLVAAQRPAWTAWAVLFGNAVLIVNQILLNLAHQRRGFEKLPTVSDAPAARRKRRR